MTESEVRDIFQLYNIVPVWDTRVIEFIMGLGGPTIAEFDREDRLLGWKIHPESDHPSNKNGIRNAIRAYCQQEFDMPGFVQWQPTENTSKCGFAETPKTEDAHKNRSSALLAERGITVQESGDKRIFWFLRANREIANYYGDTRTIDTASRTSPEDLQVILDYCKTIPALIRVDVYEQLRGKPAVTKKLTMPEGTLVDNWKNITSVPRESHYWVWLDGVRIWDLQNPPRIKDGSTITICEA